MEVPVVSESPWYTITYHYKKNTNHKNELVVSLLFNASKPYELVLFYQLLLTLDGGMPWDNLTLGIMSA